MRIKSVLASLTLLLAAGLACAQDAVAYHFDNTAAHGLKGLRNMRNHIDTDPTAKITLPVQVTVGGCHYRRVLIY